MTSQYVCDDVACDVMLVHTKKRLFTVTHDLFSHLLLLHLRVFIYLFSVVSHSRV